MLNILLAETIGEIHYERKREWGEGGGEERRERSIILSN